MNRLISFAFALWGLHAVLDAAPAFPLKVRNNHRFLVDSNDAPFFVMADTPWFLQKLRLEEVRRIMDDRLAKGFNSLFLEILDDSAMPSRDAYGHVAFDPDKDITKPVEDYWRYADAVMEEAQRRGFFVIMSDLWYGAGGGLWMHHVTPESAGAYGRFLGKRYARFNNVMWMECGDRNPDDRLAECARQLALAIRQEAPQQLHTAHLSHEFASAAFFHKEAWLDVNMAYTYGASYLHVLPDNQRTAPIRPVILGETGYEDEPNDIELLPDARKGDLWNPYRIRRNAWWAVFSGASGYCAGTRLWRFEKNWPDVLNAKSTRQAPLLLRLLQSRPWWRLEPDSKHALVTAGYGRWKEANYVTAGQTADGASPPPICPGLGHHGGDGPLKGPLRVSWFDPADGKIQIVEDAAPADGERVFTAPGKNADGDLDWVLVLDAP